MGDRRLNLVFLGCGRITATHARTLAGFRDRVRCFYASRERARAMDFERRFGGAGSFGSYEAALADGWIDMALVATPPASHLELTLQALRHGKDVIVEKPAFLLSSDFDAVSEAQHSTGKRVLVAENYAYKPLAFALRDLLASGAVGDVRFVNVCAVKRQSTGDWRDDVRQAGGGALFEGGVHWIDLLANLGPVVRSVRGFRPGPAEGAERSLLLVLEYEDGAVGTLCHSWEIPSPLGGLALSRIDGTAGTIFFESNGLFVLARGRVRSLRVPGLADIRGYRAMFGDFLAALRTGREALMTLERARRELELAEEAYRSLEPGRPLEPPARRLACLS
jgi:UDP-N-acetylglucosamine 3-dehydrogenase